MKISSLGRSARSKAGIKVRQPLPKVSVKLRSLEEIPLLEQISLQIMDELNVKKVDVLDEESEVLTFNVKLNPSVAGIKYGSSMGEVEDALSREDATLVASKVRSGLPIEASGFTIGSDEVTVVASDKSGYVSVNDSGYLIAISTDIADDLKDEGLAREIVHRLQTMRRSAGFEISDHINIYYIGDNNLSRVIDSFSEYIKEETLSIRLLESNPPGEAYTETQSLDGSEVSFGVSRD
jgi:isoleucyl-tRNA synthetase